jgi:hypothetical protein
MTESDWAGVLACVAILLCGIVLGWLCSRVWPQ